MTTVLGRRRAVLLLCLITLQYASVFGYRGLKESEARHVVIPQFDELASSDEDAFLSTEQALPGFSDDSDALMEIHSQRGRSLAPASGCAPKKKLRCKASLLTSKLSCEANSAKPCVREVNGKCCEYNKVCKKFQTPAGYQCAELSDEPLECLKFTGCGGICSMWNYKCLSFKGAAQYRRCVKFGPKHAVNDDLKKKAKLFYTAYQVGCARSADEKKACAKGKAGKGKAKAKAKGKFL